MSSVRQYLRDNWLLLLASLLLAVLVWNYVNDELTESLTIWPHLAPQEIPEKLTLAKGAPTEIKVVLRGTRRSLSAVDASKMVVHYKLPTHAGPAEITLRSGDFNLPPGVEVSEFPERFNIELEEIDEKSVPVRVITEGAPQPGYAVAGVTAMPAEVKISGRHEAIDRITQLETRPIDLASKNRRFSAYAPLVIPSEVRCQPDFVAVSVDIGPQPVVRDFTDVEVKYPAANGTELKVRIDPPQISVRLRGDQKVLLAMTARDILAFVDASSLPKTARPEQQEARVRLVLPRGVELATEESELKVRIQIVEKTEK